ncbi:MAG: AMP-binding protein [Bryobacteraceae bacterium]
MKPGWGSAPREEIEARQFERLRSLLAAIVPANRFYSAKLATLGQPASLDDFRRRAPETTKSELIEDQRANPPWGANLTFPLDRYARYAQTSGTTGVPMRWADTPESWQWMLDTWRRVYDAAGVTSADRIFFAFSFGPFLGFWTAFEAASQMGALCIPGGGMRSAARLRVIADTGVTVLCCTPTYAMHLAEEAAAEGVSARPASVRMLIVAGEPGGSIAGTRARLKAAWPNAEIVDQHGMTEVGPVTYQCPARPGVLHVYEEAYFPEVIHPATGQQIPRGGEGELVLTNLGRTGSPLLRYRTGDIVRLSPSDRCQCGSWEMAFEGGIIGRTDDMVVVRGVNVYPSAVDDIVRASGGVAEYRVRVTTDRSMVELAMEVEPDGSVDAPALVHRLETALRDSLALRIPVAIAAAGSLPRFEMKARRWVVIP